MTYERIAGAQKKTVGIKQTAKAVEKGSARHVYVAQDADSFVIKPLLSLCAEKGVEVTVLDSMKSVGQACGIDVKCAACAILDEA